MKPLGTAILLGFSGSILSLHSNLWWLCVPKPTGCAALAVGEAAAGGDEEEEDESLGFVEEKGPDLDDKEKGEGREELFGVAVEDFRLEDDDDNDGVGTMAGAVLVFFTSFLLPLLRGRFF